MSVQLCKKCYGLFIDFGLNRDSMGICPDCIILIEKQSKNGQKHHSNTHELHEQIELI